MNNLPNNRKGQGKLNIASLGVIAITLVVAAVVLGMGGTILEKIQGVQTDSSTTILTNESWTWPDNNTLQEYGQTRVQISSVVVWANTTLLTLDANYTAGADGVRILNLSPSTEGVGAEIQLCIFNMTYTYNFGSEAYNSSNYGMTGVATMAEFIPTIAIVAVAAIVIGILLVFFGRKKEE